MIKNYYKREVNNGKQKYKLNIDISFRDNLTPRTWYLIPTIAVWQDCFARRNQWINFGFYWLALSIVFEYSIDDQYAEYPRS